MIKPRVIEHDGVLVARDDLFPGGTKAQFLPILFEGADEVVYASPAEGGAHLARGLARARPNARRHVVQVGRELKSY